MLAQPHLSTQQLLECLQSFNHVVYLHNNGKPMIGFLADHYVLIKQQQIQFFKQTSFHHYIQYEYEESLHAFLASGLNPQHAKLSMGFISYDFAANQQIKAQEKSQPSLFIGQFSSYLSFEQNAWYFMSSALDAEALYTKINALILKTPTQEKLQLKQACQARWSFEAYQAAFEKVQDYIVAGDCYQINLTQEFQAEATGSLISVANQFWTLTNAPYSGYIRINDFELLSCSPELFIDFQAHRKIITKPIKGTMPRYNDAVLDQQSKQRLADSKKDQAENVMIVDLLRNDLSVYAETGSVKTPKLFEIESFKQVHHMVSEIEATLKANIDPFELLLSALPGGSITGAPKIRAMQIIDEIEQGARGAYCGSMGYFDSHGMGAWNILIRSIQKYQHELSVWAGGGVTIASDCQAEYQECFDKVSALLTLLNQYDSPRDH